MFGHLSTFVFDSHLNDVMAYDQASEKLFELFIEARFIHLGCLLKSFSELFEVDKGIDIKSLSHDA